MEQHKSPAHLGRILLLLVSVTAGMILAAMLLAVAADVSRSSVRALDAQIQGQEDVVAARWSQSEHSMSQTWTVCPAGPPDCQYRFVQEAIDAAGDGDTIKVAMGVYADVHSRTAPPGYPYFPVSHLITQTMLITKSLTVRGGYTTTNWDVSNPISYPTTLDAQRQGRVVAIVGEISATIEGLSITGGDAQGLGGGPPLLPSVDFGGGVYALSATVSISNNKVYSNVAAHGGGLYLAYSNATLIGTAVADNLADEHTNGGGLYLLVSNALLRDNAFVDNAAGHNGGGVFVVEGEALFDRNTFSANTASFGAGLFVQEGDPDLHSNIFAANAASKLGGGVFLWRTTGTLQNTVVVDNSALQRGSGLYICCASPRLLHTTVVHNIGGDGSGVHVRCATPTLSSSAFLTNTIIVSHTVGVTVGRRSTATLVGTLWGSEIWANETDWSGGGTVDTGTVNVWGDPAFAEPDTDRYHIGPWSAAIDRGVGTAVATDIDGEARPIGLGFDLGADEARGVQRVFLPHLAHSYVPPMPPTTGEFTSSVPSGMVGQPVTFTTTYRDPNGWQDISTAGLMINIWQKKDKGLAALYDAAANTLQLWSDDGASIVGECQPGQVDALSNSYVSLDCAATAVSGSDDTLTIAWRVTPLAPFSDLYGTYAAFLMAWDAAGHEEAWNPVGTWTLVQGGQGAQ